MVEIINDLIENTINKAFKSNDEILNNIRNESSVIRAILKEGGDIHPKIYKKHLNSSIDVFQKLDNLKLKNPKTRQEIVEQSKYITNLLFDFCFQDDINNEFYIKLKRKVFNIKRKIIIDRFIIILFVNKCEEKKMFNYSEKIDCLGNYYCKKLLANIVDRVAEKRGLRQKRDIKEKVSDMKSQLSYILKEDNETFENLKKRNEDLKNALILVNENLEEYENDLEKYKEEIVANIVSEFFNTLNSDKYGNLLDNFNKCQKTLKKLKKDGYEFPQEVESIPILIRQYMKFIADYGVNSIEKREKISLGYEEAKKVQYNGTPFKNVNDIKNVEVVSSGWIYKDVVISMPKCNEIIKLKEE